MKRFEFLKFIGLLLVLLSSMEGRSQAPNWTPPNAAGYQYSLNVTAVTVVDGSIFSNNTQDRLAFFVGDELRGVSTPFSFPRNLTGPATAIHTATVFANMASGEQLTVRYYDAANDRVLEAMQTIPFAHAALLGSLSEVLEVHFGDAIDLDIQISAIPEQMTMQGLSFATIDLGDYLEQQDNDPVQWSFTPNPLLNAVLNGDELTITSYDAAFTGSTTLPIRAEELTVNNNDAVANITYTVTASIPLPEWDEFPNQTADPISGFETVAMPSFLMPYDGDCLAFSYKPIVEGTTMDADPGWAFNLAKPNTMTLVLRPIYTDACTFTNPDDRLAGFVNGSLAGVAVPQFIGGEVFYYLSLGSDFTTGDLDLQFYSATHGQLLTCPMPMSFVTYGSLGTVLAPELLDFSPLEPHVDANGNLTMLIRNPDWEGVQRFILTAADCNFPNDRKDDVTVGFCVGLDTDEDGFCDLLDEAPNDPCIPNYIDPTLAIADENAAPVVDGGNRSVEIGADATCYKTYTWLVTIGDDCQLPDVAVEINNAESVETPLAELQPTPVPGIYELHITAYLGTNVLTLTVTDSYDNETAVTYSIAVSDGSVRETICQDITVQLNAAGQATITAAMIDNGSSDACGILDMVLDISTFDCTAVGENAVELTVTDNNGNTAACMATVLVEDNVLPSAECQDITVQLNADGQATITPAMIDDGSADACEIVSRVLDVSAFDCTGVGGNTVELTVTDANGNAAACIAMVTVEDNVLPSAECQDITVQLNAAGQATITPAMIDDGSADACEIVNRVLDNSAFDCADAGDNTVELTVTDANGNAAACTATVTVLDNTTPGEACDPDGDGATIAQGDPDSADPCTPNENALACNSGDFDGDGVPNSVETSEGTDPADPTDFADSNGNGVSDYVEVTGSFPNGDADGDGISDGYETGDQNPYIDNDGDGVPAYLDDDDNDSTIGNEDGEVEPAFDSGIINGIADFQEISVCQDCALMIEDPCACLNNASSLNLNTNTGGFDGQFSEYISIQGVGGAPLPPVFEFRVVAVNGAFDAYNVPVVGNQSAGLPVAVGALLVYNAVTNEGHYQLPFVHLDGQGYGISVQQFAGGQPVGEIFTINNKCAYPQPVFDPMLSAAFCEQEAILPFNAVDLAGIGGMASFTIDGLSATEFDPNLLGQGTHLVSMTYTGAEDGNSGVSPDGGLNPAYPGCVQVVDIAITVGEVEIGCIGNINVTLGENCQALVTPAMVLSGNYACADEVVISINGEDSNIVDGCGEHTYLAEVLVNGTVYQLCWGNINAEDKTAPTVDCPDDISSIDAVYAQQSYSGTLDATDGTVAMEDFSCFTDFFNPTPGDHEYELITFTPSATDVYTFVGQSEDFDVVLALFQTSFHESNPCQNIIGQVATTFVGTLPSTLVNIFMDLGNAQRLSLPLRAGETYVLMVSNANDGDLGDYTVDAYSDGSGTLTTFSAPADVEFDIDLTCNDIDRLRIVGEQTYVVNAAGTEINNSMSASLRTILEYTGFPTVRDNCGDVRVTVSDVVSASGDCGDVVITRTFRVVDRVNRCQNSTGAAGTDVCTQRITFRKLSVEDLVLPPFTAPIECDEDFATDGNLGGPDANPVADATGYPWVITAFGFIDLADDYCNMGASYSDEPRINVCDATYKFRREWNIIDWCEPGDSFTWDQFIKVGDFTGPEVSLTVPDYNNDGQADNGLFYSTSPYSCEAVLVVPTPTTSDNCGDVDNNSWEVTILVGGVDFYWTGSPGMTVNIPVGDHTITFCVSDGCGNETCVTYDLIVRDEIEPYASCDDDLNVSIGGGQVDINGAGQYGIARIFAADVNEGSNDNCGAVTLEVRRNYWLDGTCSSNEDHWSPWGESIEFYCCDIATEVTIELRATDAAGNTNVCWMVITPEDKLNPHCVAPQDQTLSCANLPVAFPGDIEAAYADDFAGTSLMMDAIFGAAGGYDNCAVDTIVERTPTINVNDCGWGTITRRFEAWQIRPEGDVNGNGRIDQNEVFRSTNTCTQVITITETHDFVIDFPQDADADCADPCVWDIVTTTTGCDVISINRGEPQRFEATGDECYKLAITYDVINWCLWDGESEGYVIARRTEDDGEALPVDRAVESMERPRVVIAGTPGALTGVIDRTNDRRTRCEDGTGGFVNGDDSNLGDESLTVANGGLRGRWIYTQFVKVYDSSAPEVTVEAFGGPTELCPTLEPGQFGDVTGACEAPVEIPFRVDDICELFDSMGVQVVNIISAELDAFAVDADRDGDIKSHEFVTDANVLANVAGDGEGNYVFSGSFPIITTAMGDNIYHAIRVVFEDGCGNRVSDYIQFEVIDCKGPAPICIEGLTVTLMPQLPDTDADGDGDTDNCAMAIWAADFEGSPIYDCTGEGAEHPTIGGQYRVQNYSIYRAADIENGTVTPRPGDTGLVLTDDDESPTVVYVYAFDQEGNYDYCETYVQVQFHTDCGTGSGTIAGVIMTEEGEATQGVEVNLNGQMSMSMVTPLDGHYEFANLEAGFDYTVTPYNNNDHDNGVTTFDIVKISKHILGTELLAGPYKRIAADANRSGTVTTLDLIQIRKVVLTITPEFTNNTSWRFVPRGYDFPVPTDPWSELFPELFNVNNLSTDVLDADFVAIKIGDVNSSAATNLLDNDDRTLNGRFDLETENIDMVAGNVYTVDFTGVDMPNVEGYQATLQVLGAELVDVHFGAATSEHFGLHLLDQNMLTTSWNGAANSDERLFTLVIRATQDARLSEVLKVSSRYTEAEAYHADGRTMDMGLRFTDGTVLGAGFELYQNTPNPFVAETMIGYTLPTDGDVTLTVSDANGRVLTVLKTAGSAGYNQIRLTKQQLLGATGVLTYTVTAGEYTATRQMVVLK